MPTTTSEDFFGTCEQRERLPRKVTSKLESCLTHCVMSWTCSSSSAAHQMALTMADMMRGAMTPKGWERMSWMFHVERNNVHLQLMQVPAGSLASEGALELPF